MLNQLLLPEESDALSEIFNIGMGQAANSLSQLVNDEVDLSVPSLDIITLEQLGQYIGYRSGEIICGVKERFHGPFSGEAILFFPEEDSLALLKNLLGDELGTDSLSEMEQEALREVGNIILNACLSTVASLFGKEIATELPLYVRGDLNALFVDAAQAIPRETLLFLKMQFAVRVGGHTGYVIFVMDIDSLATFKQCLEPLLAA